MGPDAMILGFWMLSLSQLFHSPLSIWSRDSLVLLQFLPFDWYHLLIWGCWYFPWQSWFHFVSNLAQHFTWCNLHKNIMDNFWKALSMEMAWYSFMLNYMQQSENILQSEGCYLSYIGLYNYVCFSGFIVATLLKFHWASWKGKLSKMQSLWFEHMPVPPW